MAAEIKAIPLENLLVDLFNPRHDEQSSQRDAISMIAHDQGIKLFNLARDIVDNGLNPSDLVIVTAADQESMYTVLEGNRRVAALKLLASPQLLISMDLNSNLEERYRDLQRTAGQVIPSAINCVVVSREDAVYWIHLKHTGENEGIGIVSWDGVATARFRGGSAALQAVQMVAKSEYIDDETKKKLSKIPITNIERVLGTPEARKALGVDVKGKQLIIVAPNEEEAVARLAILVSEVANKVVKVTDLDSKDQRVTYAHRVAALPLPTPGAGPDTGETSPIASKAGTARRVNPHRKTLIPRELKLTIRHTRINQIYHELQNINVNEFRNCCAVMLRVFIELSVDHYAERKTISLKPSSKPGTTPPSDKEMKLRDKIRTVADHLEQNNICDKGQLHGIRALISQQGHMLSVDSLNAYVHNKEFNPTASDLRANWDSIQAFVVALWTA